MNIWIVDPKTKEPSVTLTAFMGGFAVACVKLLLAGITIGSVTLQVFSGGEFAAVVGSLGAIYAMRKQTDAGASNGKD